MLPVHTIDIDGEQWEIQDAGLRGIFETFLQRYKNDMVLSEWEEITISTDPNNPTVMQYDGFLVIRSPVYSGANIYVNGVYVITTTHSSYGNSVYEGTSATLPIKKNDRIYKTVGAGNTTPSYVAYYKLRDYTNRQ